MGSKSDYLENKVIDHVLGGVTYTPVATTYIALCTTTPTDASTGATIVEVANSNNYSRVSVTINNTNWPNATAGLKKNGTTITFPTASGSWGTVTSFAILDSGTYGAGNVLFWSALDNNKTIDIGDTVSFAINAIQVQED